MKIKGVMHPTGPIDMYRLPPTSSIDVSVLFGFTDGKYQVSTYRFVFYFHFRFSKLICQWDSTYLSYAICFSMDGGCAILPYRGPLGNIHFHAIPSQGHLTLLFWTKSDKIINMQLSFKHPSYLHIRYL